MNAIQLKIADPCHENWANMQVNEQGRFCSSCKKSVIDFTMMDNRELINTIINNDANICGRFTYAQLDTAIRSETEKKSRWQKYFFSLLVPAFLFAKQTVAQKTMGKVKATKAVCNTAIIYDLAKMPGQKHFRFSGKIIDAATHETIIGATVQLSNLNAVATDTSGNFSLTCKMNADTVKVIISAISYETKEIIMAVPVDDFIVSNEIISLNQISKMLGEVVVASDVNRWLCDRVTGGVSISTRVNKYSLLSNRLMTAMNDSIKIFPNPVQRGSAFSTSLKLKQPGNYSLQVVDASGRIVVQQQINAVSNKHQQKIACSDTWSSGIYFLRVLGNENRLVSNSRFVVK